MSLPLFTVKPSGELRMVHELFIAGVVRPQGSLSLWRNPKTGTEVAKYSDHTIMWRQTMHGALTRWWAGEPPIQGPVRVTLDATFARPKWHLGTGRNEGIVKQSAPTYHTAYPDADKCARACGDSLVDSGVIADDSQISIWHIRKRWCDIDATPGALIKIEELVL